MCIELPVPRILMSTPKIVVAGQNTTLTCSAIAVDGLVAGSIVEATWSDNNGDHLRSSTMERNDSNTTVTLTFTPIFLSRGGQYTCNASILIPAISVVTRNFKHFDVVIQSKVVFVY